MYSKTQLITAIKKEITILEHLVSKVTPELHDHQFTEAQRTIRELLAYLAASPWKQTELIITWDMSIFANMKEYSDSFVADDFISTLHTNSAKAIAMIEELDNNALNEEVSIFNGFVHGSRAQLLVEMVYAQMIAYKMQLFLQMKHAGLHHLGTPNLWMWIDKPQG
jgi:hypothetical protein